MRMVPLFSPQITPADRKAVDRQMRTGWVGPGKAVEEFEAALCETMNAKHCVCTSSGTAAIVAALIARNNAYKEDRPLLIAPGYGHPAAINAAAVLGYQVILCDVTSTNGCMFRQRLVELVETAGEAGGVVAYTEHNGHVLGTAETYNTLRGLKCWGSNWLFIQDSCQSLQNAMCRTYGDVAILSFSPQKIITAGQGGALLTNNAAFAEAARQAVTQGVRDRGKMPPRPRSVGVNLRMTNLQAALGLSQLARLKDLRKTWARTRVWYGEDQATRWCPCVQVADPTGLIKDLAGEFIEAGCLYEQAAMNVAAVGARKHEIAAARKLASTTVYLPAHHKVTHFHTRKVRRVLQAYDIKTICL